MYHEDKPDTAMLLALEALTIAEREKSPKLEAYSWLCIGSAYAVTGNLTQSLEAELKALKISEEIKDSTTLTSILNNISLNYSARKDYRTSLHYLQSSLVIGKRVNHNPAITFGNMSMVYNNLELYDSSLYFAMEAYLASEKISDKRQKGGSLLTLGSASFKKGKRIIALNYYIESLPLLAETSSHSLLSTSLLGIAEVYREQRQTDSAFVYAKASFGSAYSRGLMLRLYEASTFLSSIYKENGNLDSAFKYLEIAKSSSDSIFNQKSMSQLQAVEIEELMRQKELQTAKQLAKEERRMNLQYAAIAIGLFSLIIFYFLFSHSIIANQKLIKYLGIVSLLLVFEFLNLLLHNPLGSLTNHSPILMLLALVVLAAMLAPLHHKMEHWITHQLVEKNKRIRLAAAKRTIQQLEG
ncbi:MAG TPA: tetratricopeptide repeat protein [Flavitalea sp.]|nr:tetratricopeptide repeat protein [Flavitalea sp.]